MPTSSPYPHIDIPNQDIFQFMFERKDKPYPDNKVIYVDSETKRSYTFASVKSTALDFGKGLKAVWEWRKGDVLALYTPNCIDFPPIVWGCLWAGGIVSPANPAYTVKELAYQLKDSGARAIVTQRPFLKTAVEAAKSVGIPPEMIILMGDERDPTARHKHFTSIRNISGAARYRKTKINPQDDLAFLVYSSGTTGLPKGVMLTHRNIVANVLQACTVENRLDPNGGPDGQGERVLAFLPFFHIYGLTCQLHFALYQGWVLVCMVKFDIERFCQLVQEHKVSFVYLVPPIVLALAKHPVVEKYDLSSIKMLNCGAAPMTRELQESLYERLGLKVKQGYGLTETSPTTHTQEWEDWRVHIGSVGKLVANQTAKYVSPEGEEVPIGETGELWIKGPNIFKGYLNNPEATANALTPDGFFKTGDIGFQDKEGNMYITERLKELIKYKGFQVPPAELEGLLVDHPSITDAAVIGVYDTEQATELPRAYCVLKKGVEQSDKTANEIASWVAGKVAPHKRLRGGIMFIDEVPKSASGKILRRVLKDKAKSEGVEKAKL
ncbi:4-coumarate-CoA ligase-like protein [Rhizodiscina lignyota]|uniref:4-coumarate-CoA ligase-like protein n=1 Tax=Rhizodiscina lignyota TaxID=1504668 RepID=A0A9P4IG85_9PEZI|nr:4-coumarate-CoA ligase-like protein [Rhizodiscina lignyota]